MDSVKGNWEKVDRFLFSRGGPVLPSAWISSLGSCVDCLASTLDPLTFQQRPVGLLIWTCTEHCSELQTLDRNVQAPVCRHPLRVSSSDSVVTIISQSCKFLHIYISCVLSVSLVQHWLIHIHISMIISPWKFAQYHYLLGKCDLKQWQQIRMTVIWN